MTFVYIPNIMKIFKLHTKQKLPITIQAAWDFLSDPKNLKDITPDKMNFNITDCDYKKIYPGQIIQYTVTPICNGATSVNATNLPTGVTATLNNNVIDVSGTPTAQSSGTYNYSLTVSGTTKSSVVTGTISVVASSKVSGCPSPLNNIQSISSKFS